MPSLTDDDFDLENLEVTGGDEDPNAEALGRDDVEDAPIVRFVNKILLDAIKKGASDIHFEPYEKIFRIRTRIDGVLKEVALAAGAARGQDRRPAQGHVAARHRRAPRAAGRPHQDAALQESGHRFSRQHLPDAVRREGGHPYSRSLERHAGHRCVGLRTRAARDLSAISRQAPGHDFGDRPHRQRQDRVAVHGPQHPQYRRLQHLHRGGSGRNQPARHQPGERQQQGGTDLRIGAARVSAPRPRRHHGRRNPRSGNRRDRDQGRADRPLGAIHLAHQRCAPDA